MDLLSLQRRTDSTMVECWDDDEDLQGSLELKSSAISITGPRSRADRESISSRMSFKSDGFDFDDDPHEQACFAPECDTTVAIESAKRASIPLPQNSSKSALMGGTINHLNKHKPRLIPHDDWSEDLELPSSGALAVKTAQFTDFPNSIHHHKPLPREEPPTMSRMLPNITAASTQLSSHLSKYIETDNDVWDDEDIPTLRVPAKSNARKAFGGLLSPPLSASKESPNEEAFDADFILPEGGLQLQLKHDQNRSSPTVLVDSDFEEWVDGNRHQGTTHRARSTRSSSVSLMSPTLSSVHTFDSDDDENLEGLQLPEGPIDFVEILEKRKQNDTPEPSLDFELHRKATKEDFLSGLEIGDGDLLDSAKMLNRNVKRKTTRAISPARRAAVGSNSPPTDVVKTTSTVPPRSRIPRLHGMHNNQLPSMDSVTDPRQRKMDLRTRYSNPPVIDHNAFGQMGSFFHPHPTPPPSIPSGTARPRSRPSAKNLQPSQQPPQPPTTTSAQLLRLKRSIPSITRQNTTSPNRAGRPPSRTDTPNPLSALNSVRPTTPNDRKDGAPLPVRRPFIPGGSSVKQSHNVNVKTVNRSGYKSEDIRPSSRLSNSRPARDTPPPPPSSKATTHVVAAESLKKEAAAMRLVTRPARKRNFGDGTELEVFDDLPTSQKTEQKFMKEPIAKGAPRALRARSIPVQTPPPPGTPPVAKETTPSKTPNFAKDTNASRTAREQRIAALASSSASSHWKNMISNRSNSGPKTRSTAKKTPQQRPHLIKPLGNQSSIPKAVKGMTYNPKTYRWEGNENSLEEFDRHQAITPPRPALITNINSNTSGISKGIQIVGDMLFDPQRMCWLKVSNNDEDDEGDPFEGVDDLLDEVVSIDGTNVSGLGTSCGEWIVGEEFDVGPEFVRRQREEEERWRRRVDGWVGGSMSGLLGQRNENIEWRKRWELWNLVVEN
ncbi:hypothetical protein BDZ91DRAFT_109092 [Kalaharituber pfeilii]|nr:hypothetical protein BDZ91DRAFT_109092 [Kalaharituber pfeilii]